MRLFLCVLALITVAACDSKPDFTSLEGRWLGANGTILTLAKEKDDAYSVVIRTASNDEDDLPATESNGKLQFRRQNIVETITPGKGKDTGVPELAGKRDCLIIKAGEGYCRD